MESLLWLLVGSLKRGLGVVPILIHICDGFPIILHVLAMRCFLLPLSGTYVQILR